MAKSWAWGGKRRVREGSHDFRGAYLTVLVFWAPDGSNSKMTSNSSSKKRGRNATIPHDIQFPLRLFFLYTRDNEPRAREVISYMIMTKKIWIPAFSLLDVPGVKRASSCLQNLWFMCLLLNFSAANTRWPCLSGQYSDCQVTLILISWEHRDRDRGCVDNWMRSV